MRTIKLVMITVMLLMPFAMAQQNIQEQFCSATIAVLHSLNREQQITFVRDLRTWCGKVEYDLVGAKIAEKKWAETPGATEEVKKGIDEMNKKKVEETIALISEVGK